jgi:hypothetical protein
MLGLITQTLESLGNQVERQVTLWNGFVRYSEALKEWDLMLGRLHEKADDLTIWKQIFFHSEEAG